MACVVRSSGSMMEEIYGLRSSDFVKRGTFLERNCVNRRGSGSIRRMKRFKYDVPRKIFVVSFLTTPNQTSVDKSPIVTQSGTTPSKLNPLALAPWIDGRFGGV